MAALDALATLGLVMFGAVIVFAVVGLTSMFRRRRW